MRRPTSVKIRKQRIKIIYTEGPPADNCSGTFDPEKMEIRVQDCKNWRRILRHEVTHGIITLSGYSHLMTPEVEEGLCDIMEFDAESYLF